ncbi:MAG: Cna B-type domain-containing protein [Anaerovoracaceae bacterium]|jgi:TQXA domain-containing protein/LPXTG-motif cell wall-anchored protein
MRSISLPGKILTFLLAGLLSVVGIAAIPNSTVHADDTYYATSASNSIGQVHSISIADPAGSAAVAYCYNHSSQWPGSNHPSSLPNGPGYTKHANASAQEFAANASGAALSADELKSAALMTMYHGYPKDASGYQATYNLTDDEFRTVTQKVLWYFTDNNITTIDENSFTGGNASAASATRMYNAAQALLQKAQGTADYPSNYELDLYTTTDTDSGGTTYQNLLRAQPSAAATQTSISFTKQWTGDSASDRPGTLSTDDDFFGNWLQLQKTENGTTTDVTGYTPAITVDSNDSSKWTVSYTNLPETTGTYSVKETIPSDSIYSTTDDTVEQGETLTNSVQEISNNTTITFSKTWVDNSNADSTRPSSTDAANDNGKFSDWLQLQQTVNGETSDVSGYTPTITENGNTWTVTYSNLPDINGTYSVKETIPSGRPYTTSDNTAANGETLTNIETTSIIVTKAWNDSSNQDGIRPSITDTDNGHGIFANWLKLQQTVNGTTTDVTGYTPAITENSDNTNQWTIMYSGLPKYTAAGTAITYSVAETVPDDTDYEVNDPDDGGTVVKTGSASNNGELNNNHTAETQNSITFTKTWTGDTESNRPDDSTFISWLTLKQTVNGTTSDVTGTYTPTIAKNGNSWTVSYTGLPAIEGTYSVQENPSDSYQVSGSKTVENGGTLTNQYMTISTGTTLTFTKTWNDNSNADSTRPSSTNTDNGNGIFANWLKLQQTVNGTTTDVTGYTPTITENGNSWTVTYSGLPEINGTYSVKETIPSGRPYTTSDNTAANGETLTNIETTSIIVTKAWNDSSNQDGIRPSITDTDNGHGIFANWLKLQQTVNGTTTDVTGYTPAITENSDNTNQWTIMYSGLPKYTAAGTAITYSVAETVPDDTDYEVNDPDDGGTVVKTGSASNLETLNNNHTAETQNSITFTKTWTGDTENDRPDDSTFISWLTLKQTVNGTTSDVTGTYTPTITKSGNSWTVSYTGLPAIAGTYSVQETIPSDSIYSTTDDTVEQGETLTNSVQEISNNTTITFSKTWVDNSNAGSTRPSSTDAANANGKFSDWLQLQQTVNGETSDVSGYTPTITENGNTWTVTYSNLPDIDGTYSVKETIPSGRPYTSSNDTVEGGETLTNTRNASTSVKVTKQWLGDPTGAVTVHLFANGSDTGESIELDGAADETGEASAWNGVFGELDKYDANGNLIEYTVSEDSMENAEQVGTVRGNMADGFALINRNTSTISIPVEKKWARGAKGEKAIIVLKINGEISDQKLELSEKNNWKGSFDNLPKYDENGEQISYAVTEEGNNWTFKIKEDGSGGYIVTNYPKDAKITEDHSGTDTDVSSAQTGDSTNLGVLLLMLGTASAAMLGTMLVRRRKKTE